LVHRDAGRLAEEVPQGDVDGGDGRAEDINVLEIRAALEGLPEVLDPPRLLADQELPEVVEHPVHGQLVAGDAPLAEPAEAGVGLQLDDVLVPKAHPHRESFDRRDLHPSHSRHCWSGA
jgi:hypothetical protein